MSTITRLLDKAMAVLRRDFLIATRYRASFPLGLAGGALEMAGLFYLSKAIGPGFRPDGMDSYPFLLVGTGLYTFLFLGISSFVSAIQEAQQAGTLEILLTTSTSPPLLLLISAISSFMGKGAGFLVYLSAGLLISGIHVGWSSLLPGFVVLLLSVILAAAIGISAAALQLSIQKGAAVTWLLGSALWLLSGAMFPVSALPRWVQFVANGLPLTHALNAMRMSVLEADSSGPLQREIAILATFGGLLLPISFMIFRAALRQARLNGSLSYS